jgi:hypothetical protein
MEWHLKRSVELGAQMDAERFEDVLIETDDRDVTSVARDVLRRAGWLPA